MPQAFFGFAQLTFQLREALATDVFEFHVLQVLPDPFIGVQLRGIAGKSFELQSPSSTTCEELFYGFAAVDGRAVPDYEQLARDLPEQVL